MTGVVSIRIAPLLFCAACLCLCGCYTPQAPTGNGQVFRESKSADAIFLFYRWDNLFIIRPEYRDNGFQRPLRRQDLDAAINALNVRRGMAVVLVGWSYDPRDLTDIIEGWRSALSPLGFHRIVCVYGDDNNKLDGAPVIDDWNQPIEQPTKTAIH